MGISLKTYHPDQGISVRSIDAANVEDAMRQLEGQGFTVLGAQAAGARRTARRGRFPLVLFATELATLLRAGLNITEAIDVLAKREQRSRVAGVLAGLHTRLAEGLPLSRAMEGFPGEFPELLLATVRASERTGGLLDALERFLSYRRQLDVARTRITGASLYPAIIVSVGLAVMLFLLAFVIPRFSAVYEQLGDHVPIGTRFLIGWGQLVRAHGGTVLMVVVVAAGLAVGWLSRPATRAGAIRAAWRVPQLGPRLRLFQLSRFYRTLGMLQGNGIPLIAAIGMARTLLIQPALAQGVTEAERRISEGAAVGESFAACGLTDEASYRLIRVGERNGEIGAMFTRIADFYDEELGKWLDWATRVFEPLLMTLVGVLIGAVVMMMYLPIFQLADGLQ